MRAAAYFAVVCALALWAGNWIVARAVRDDIAPGLITTSRVVLVMLTLAPIALPGLLGRLRAFAPRDWAVLAGLGLFGGGLHNAMQYLGLHYTTATNGTLFFSLSPVTIMVLAGLALGERVRAMQWVGVAVSFAGVPMTEPGAGAGVAVAGAAVWPAAAGTPAAGAPPWGAGACAPTSAPANPRNAAAAALTTTVVAPVNPRMQPLLRIVPGVRR